MRHYELVGLGDGVLIPKILPAEHHETDTPAPPREESFELQMDTLVSIEKILRTAPKGTPKYEHLRQVLTQYDCPETYEILLTDTALRNELTPIEDRNPLTLMPKFEPKVIYFPLNQR